MAQGVDPTTVVNTNNIKAAKRANPVFKLSLLLSHD